MMPKIQKSELSGLDIFASIESFVVMFCFFLKEKDLRYNSVSKVIRITYQSVPKPLRYSQNLGSYLPKSPVLLPQLDDVIQNTVLIGESKPFT